MPRQRRREKKDASTDRTPRKEKRAKLEIPNTTETKSQEMFPLELPSNLKQLLVQDNEKVKAKKLARLPMKPSISEILQDFLLTYKSDEFSVQIMGEVVAGVKVYFQHCLPSLLLYKFEAPQYQTFNFDDPQHDVCDFYGGIHLLRLFVKLPTLLGYTEVKPDATAVLFECMKRIVQHIQLNADRLVTMDYLDGGAEYKKRT
eukprot:gene2207-5218_t